MKSKSETVPFSMGNRILCFRLLEWSLLHFPVPMIANVLIYWALSRRFEGPPQDFMAYLGYVVMPILMYVGELAFLVIGGLAEIPAEMIAECLFPRGPERKKSVKKKWRKANARVGRSKQSVKSIRIGDPVDDASASRYNSSQVNAEVYHKTQKTNRKNVPWNVVLMCIVLLVGGILIIKELNVPARKSEPLQESVLQEQEKAASKKSIVETTPTVLIDAIPEALPTIQEETVPVGNADPVEYEVVRWDRSYSHPEGASMSYYYDYVEINDGEPGCQKINLQLYQDAELFMNEMTQEQIETPILSVYGTIEDGILTMGTEVTHNGQGFLSMQFTRNYYMGGNHSTKTVTAATYSLKTGEKVGLAEILPDMKEDMLTQMLADLVFQNVVGYVYDDSGMLDSIYQMLCNYTLESFEFLIVDSEIQLLFVPNQFVGGPYSYKLIPTGLYIE